VLLFLGRRLGWAILLAFVVTLITFVVFFVLPANLHNTRRDERGTDLQTQFDARGAVPVQYLHFLGHVVLRGDLGSSTASRDPVIDVIGRTLPVTASLVVGGAVLWLLIAFPIGILSALRPRSLLDKGLMLVVVAGASAHSVWVSLVLSYVFGVKLRVLPISGYCDIHYHANSESGCGGPRYWAYHMILPWLAYALVFAALYARMIRANLLEALGEDYIRTARAKGASTFRVVRSHALRNALLPVITMFGMDVGVAFGGALFIENVFELPGMGRLFARSIANGDVPVIMGVALVVSLAVVVANLLVDLLYSVVDPRVRRSGQGSASLVPGPVRRRRARTPVTESAT
jgi:peptide/nickel transport system permease protein